MDFYKLLVALIRRRHFVQWVIHREPGHHCSILCWANMWCPPSGIEISRSRSSTRYISVWAYRTGRWSWEFQAVTIDQANVYFKPCFLYSVQKPNEDTIQERVFFKSISDKDPMQAFVRTIEGNIRAFKRPPKTIGDPWPAQGYYWICERVRWRFTEEWGLSSAGSADQWHHVRTSWSSTVWVKWWPPNNQSRRRKWRTGFTDHQNKTAEAEGNAIKIARRSGKGGRRPVAWPGRWPCSGRKWPRGYEPGCGTDETGPIWTNVILFSMWTEAIKNFAEYGKGKCFSDGSSEGNGPYNGADHGTIQGKAVREQ